MNENKQSKRVAISMSAAVRLALEMTARRNGLATATQASVLVRQALDRTMQSEAFKDELRAAKAGWTTAQRLDDMADDHEMELLYAEAKKAETEARSGTTTTPHQTW